MQIIIVLSLAFFMGLLSGCVNSKEVVRNSDCNSEKYAEIIRVTETKVLSRGIVREPNDLLHPGQPYACAVIAFSINSSGVATSMKVLEVYPSRVFSDSALIALDKYRFRTDESGMSGVLLFEAQLQSKGQKKEPK